MFNLFVVLFFLDIVVIARSISFCQLADPDLKCSTIIQLFHNDFPASEAKVLATYLDVPPARIQEFRDNNIGNAKGMLIDMLNYWLETDSKKSWTKLAKAVEYCGHGVLAEKIRRKSTK